MLTKVKEARRQNVGGARFAIVASKYNSEYVDSMVSAAENTLTDGGAAKVQVVRVPGAFEIPVAAKRLATQNRYHAILCLGAVIRGATPHFDYVAGQVSSGIASVALETGVPCIFGILTTETVEQAIERAGTKMGNKGWEAALSAVEMAHVLAQLQGAW